MTEIDYLNSAVVALALAHRGDAAANRRTVALVLQAESESHVVYDGTTLLRLLQQDK